MSEYYNKLWIHHKGYKSYKNLGTGTFTDVHLLCGIGEAGIPVLLRSQTLFIGKWAYLSWDV